MYNQFALLGVFLYNQFALLGVLYGKNGFEKIIEWNRYRTKPLIIYGARQIGKTYLIKKLFAERFYKNNYVYIDFKQDDDMRTFVLSGGANGGSVCDAKKLLNIFH